jgi:3-hydroxy-9,10-secoandrosta-1,3,5(10)-triene-9,17-dione monooxygenase
VSNLLERAEALAPLFRDNARAAEAARRPSEHVIQAIKESGLFALMVPKAYGGHEADLDTFFDVVLTLSRADASMGWLTGFLIEHNLWVLNYSDEVCSTVFGDDNYVLAPATLNVGAGTAEAVDGGYRLSGQWQWGTGILHSRWVLAGGIAMVEQTPTPTFFLLPIEDVELVDTWFMSGMCATGSWDFKVNDVFIPQDRALPFQSILDATSGISARFAGPLYRTPLMPVLGFAAGLPILGAAQSALSNFAEQMRGKLTNKVLRSGMPQPDVSKVLGEVSLKVETAELLMRSVLQDVMSKRNEANSEERTHWLSQIAFAVHTCKEASIQLADVTGASGGHLDNPVQRAVRDIAVASNHVVFSKDSQYTAVGRNLLGQ